MEKERVKRNSCFNCDDCELQGVCNSVASSNCIFEIGCKMKKSASCFPIQIFLGVIATLFGIVLLLPYHTFKSHAYLTMLQIANENIWGMTCLMVGLFQLYVILTSKSKIFMVISLSLQAFVWSFVGTMLLVNDLILGNTINTGFTTYMTIAGLALYTSYRLR
jgi:hypothetical protein